MTRRFLAPWTVEKIAGGFKVIDAKGQSLACVYWRETKDAANIAGVLTEDEARRIASDIAKLAELLSRIKRAPTGLSLTLDGLSAGNHCGLLSEAHLKVMPLPTAWVSASFSPLAWQKSPALPTAAFRPSVHDFESKSEEVLLAPRLYIPPPISCISWLCLVDENVVQPWMKAAPMARRNGAVRK